MKRISSRKTRLGFYARAVDKKTGEVRSIKCRIKNRILVFLSTLSDTERLITVRVTYGEEIGDNESTHHNVASAINALSTYTEKPLLDFIEGK